MQPLGDHLGADEQVDFLRAEGIEHVTQRVFFAQRIGIDTGDTVVEVAEEKGGS